jgi:hypothetical protein
MYGINSMNVSLRNFHRRKDKEAGNTGNDRKDPESFEMRDSHSERVLTT